MTTDVQVACDDTDLPAESDIRSWASAAIEQSGCATDADLEVAVRIVGADEIRTLNRLYRDRDYATNVLSFPAGDIEGLPPGAPVLLGDIVICASVVASEAKEQGKRPGDHWAHMIVHGALHLLGFDHENDAQAVEMEALETRILATKSVTDPYEAL